MSVRETRVWYWGGGTQVVVSFSLHFHLPLRADGREVEAKRAVPREDNNPVAHSKTKKVFLGGLSMDTVEDDIREVLEQHGKVCGHFGGS